MNNETEKENSEKNDRYKKVTIVLKKYLSLWNIIFLTIAVIIGSSVFNNLKNKQSAAGIINSTEERFGETDDSYDSASNELENKLLPADGVILPVEWNDLGKKLIDSGVINEQKFIALYEQRGGLSESDKKLLYGTDNGNLVISLQNSGFLLNLLWALGLGNKNQVLEEGPMKDPKYQGADRFASTGGWKIAKGNAMEHYSKHDFIKITPLQQELVEKVSKNIYRPCCDNSTYFPDCNHGMAMLAFLELMAAQGLSENEMYKNALIVNAFWFPSTYLTIARYFQSKGVSWQNKDPKEILGLKYSSISGYRQILSEIEPSQLKGGGGCGI